MKSKNVLSSVKTATASPTTTTIDVGDYVTYKNELYMVEHVFRDDIRARSVDDPENVICVRREELWLN